MPRSASPTIAMTRSMPSGMKPRGRLRPRWTTSKSLSASPMPRRRRRRAVVMLSRLIQLGEVATIISGQHVSADNVSETLSDVPYLTGPTDFRGKAVAATRSTSAGTAFALAGDLLVTVKGSGVGSAAIADQRYAISRQLMAVRARDGFDQGFINQLVWWWAIRLARQSRGTIPGLSRQDLLELGVPDVSFAEQTK